MIRLRGSNAPMEAPFLVVELLPRVRSPSLAVADDRHSSSVAPPLGNPPPLFSLLFFPGRILLAGRVGPGPRGQVQLPARAEGDPLPHAPRRRHALHRHARGPAPRPATRKWAPGGGRPGMSRLIIRLPHPSPHPESPTKPLHHRARRMHSLGIRRVSEWKPFFLTVNFAGKLEQIIIKKTSCKMSHRKNSVFEGPRSFSAWHPQI